MTKLTENSMMNRYFFSYPAVKDFFTHTYMNFPSPVSSSTYMPYLYQYSLSLHADNSTHTNST